MVAEFSGQVLRRPAWPYVAQAILAMGFVLVSALTLPPDLIPALSVFGAALVAGSVLQLRPRVTLHHTSITIVNLRRQTIDVDSIQDIQIESQDFLGRSRVFVYLASGWVTPWALSAKWRWDRSRVERDAALLEQWWVSGRRPDWSPSLPPARPLTDNPYAPPD